MITYSVCPLYGGKGPEYLAKFRIADIILYGAVKGNLEKGYRCDEESRKICHDGRWQLRRSRHRGCLYANRNINRCADDPLTARLPSWTDAHAWVTIPVLYFIMKFGVPAMSQVNSCLPSNNLARRESARCDARGVVARGNCALVLVR